MTKEDDEKRSEEEASEEDEPETASAEEETDADETEGADDAGDDDSSDDDDDASDGNSDDDDADDDDASDGDSGDDESGEPAASAKEDDASAKKKTAKKSTTKKSSKASAGGSKKKKRKKTAGEPKKKTAKPVQPARKEPEENSTPMIIGAVIVAAVAVVGLWWWNNRDAGAEELTTLDTEEVTEETPTAAADPASPSNPFGLPQREEPAGIPAPPDVAAPPENAQRTESGLASRVLEPGDGAEHPTANARVTVHYTGWTTDGEMFDSSQRRGRPATFPLNGVIPGWTEGVQLMVTGEKRRFWIPENLAYAGRPGAPQGMLVFDVELLEFEELPPPPEAPSDVAAPPANAQRTESGLASRVLERGTGSEHPEATNVVRVHYTGWTTDGEMFDSSVTRGEPVTFPLNRVIPGWTEGVQLMVVGEKRRLWIPEDLAYQGRPGAPAGMLVFDVELLEILEAPPGMPGMPPGHPGGGGGSPH